MSIHIVKDKNDWKAELNYYLENNTTQLWIEALTNESENIRFTAYCRLNCQKYWTKALNDSDWLIRFAAYKNLHLVKDALIDKNPIIRLGAISGDIC